MKTKGAQALREKSKDELKAQLFKTRDELFQLRLDKAQNKLKNTRLLFLKRKVIANILTIIKEKKIQEEMEGKNK